MAGDWIKYEKTTGDKPEVFEIASMLGIDPDAVVGKLLRLWSWFDDHSIDGNAFVTVTPLLNRITGVTGFVDAVISVGWLESDGKTITVPNFSRHNGQTAKNRAVTAERVARSRAKCNGDVTQNVTLEPLHKALPEKRREEKSRDKSTPIVPKGDESGKDDSPKTPSYPADFLRFWEAYPKKVGKAAALKSFQRAKKSASAEEIISAVVAQKTSPDWNRDHGRFIPNPQTWLNQGRWEDEGQTLNPEEKYANGF